MEEFFITWVPTWNGTTYCSFKLCFVALRGLPGFCERATEDEVGDNNFSEAR